MADYQPPHWAKPQAEALELKVAKEGRALGAVDVSSHAAFVFGRNTEGVTCGAVTLDHDSISRRHAALVHDMQRRSHLIDLGSRHGTRVNGVALVPRKYHELKLGDSVQFGASTRIYTLQRPEAAPTRAAEAPPAVASEEPAPAEPATIDLAALRRLGPAARAKLTHVEKRALEMLSTLEDEDDPMRGYVDDPEQDMAAPGAARPAAASEPAPPGAAEEHRAEHKAAKRAKHKHHRRHDEGGARGEKRKERAKDERKGEREKGPKKGKHHRRERQP